MVVFRGGGTVRWVAPALPLTLLVLTLSFVVFAAIVLPRKRQSRAVGCSRYLGDLIRDLVVAQQEPGAHELP
jgi:hypothetical protein